MTALSTPDPMIDPMLSFLQAVVNVGIPGVATPIVQTANHPIDLELGLGELDMPILGCHRIRTQTRSFSMGHLNDELATIRFTFIGPMCSREELPQRWPLLDKVWRRIVDALYRGHDEDYEGDADVMATAGVVRVDLNSARKQEFYAEKGDYAFPSFWGEIDVLWRDPLLADVSDLAPFNRADGKFLVEGNTDQAAPDVKTYASPTQP